MMHWIIVPVILPALLAPILAFVMRHDIVLARVFSVSGVVSLLGVAVWLTIVAARGDTLVYEPGNWPAPFGIVLVLDRLSAMMVLLTALLALVVLLYAIGSGWDNRGRHFHTLCQFQLMGVCGAFLTGDAFNLFVFFEILLIASYGLTIHSGGAMRLRAGLQYVVMNLAGSTLFLFALGTLYAATGTLNIADLAVKVQEIPVEEAALLRVAAMLLLIVFAIKAALFPVQFWLPGTYANAPAPVAALFAIMTKVGAYAIIRFYTTIFGPGAESVGSLAGDWLLPAALLTLALGTFGVLGARRMGPMVAFSVLGSMGTLLIAVSLFTPATLLAALYYMLHSTFAAAALFLVVDLVVARRGKAGDRLQVSQTMLQNGLVASLFFVAAIGMAGMPPLSGFPGKLLILKVSMDSPQMVTIWATILISSLLTIVGFARAGSIMFWKTAAVEPVGDDNPPVEPGVTPHLQEPSTGLAATAVIAALSGMVLLTVSAGPVSAYLEATSIQLHDTAQYIGAVLTPDRKGVGQ